MDRGVIGWSQRFQLPGHKVEVAPGKAVSRTLQALTSVEERGVFYGVEARQLSDLNRG